MKFKGTVSKIFCSKDSGFKILVLEVGRLQRIPEEYVNPKFPANISVAGPMKDADEGYVIEVNGEWERRDNGNYWPWQLKVKGCTVCAFETPQLLTEIVAGIAGIGMTKAKQMVSVYGIEIVNILENEPDRLWPWETNNGQMKKASEDFKRIRMNADMQTFLCDYGISDSEIEQIQEALGLDAMKRIKSNPYMLCNARILSFKICDAIAKDLGFSLTSRNRVEAVFNYALKERAGAKGHVFLTVTQLLEECNGFMRDNAEIQGSFTSAVIAEHIKIFAAERKVVAENGRVYAYERYASECAVANILTHRSGMRSRYASVDKALLDECISEMQEELGFELDFLQKDAVIMAIRNQTSVLTGGPGCGKTSTLRTVIGVLEKMNRRMKKPDLQIALAAPTGMAAKRIVDSTGKEAKTIHKLLEYNPAALFQIHCESNPIDADYVILDETSMVDIDIAAMLLRAVRDDAQILLLGDINQLPSIGPGEVLANIISSELFPVVELKRSYRHGSRKNIYENAMRINDGNTELDTRHSDFQFYEIPDSPDDKDCKRLLAKVKKVFYEEYSANGRDARKVQVLSPMRTKTLVSVDKINRELQNMVNATVDAENEFYYGQTCYRKNDRVMQVSNDYDKQVFNGDTGIVSQASAKAGRLLVDFDGSLVEYKKAELDRLKHCFAVTIHKSQGQEYPVVIIPITGYHSNMLVRNLLYTGVTRGKQKVILVGDKNALMYAIQNVQGTKRNTALLERMKLERQAA